MASSRIQKICGFIKIPRNFFVTFNLPTFKAHNERKKRSLACQQKAKSTSPQEGVQLLSPSAPQSSKASLPTAVFSSLTLSRNCPLTSSLHGAISHFKRSP